ncbi:hypothetical protein NN561_011315 [Cricetulus griseus]
MARRRQGPSLRATPLCRDTQVAEPRSRSSLLASKPVSARLGLHRGITEGMFLEAWREIRSSLCIPEGTPAADREPGRRGSVATAGSRAGGARLPLYSPPEREAAKEAGSVSRAPGGKCSGRPRSSSATPGSILLMALGRCECPYLPCSPGARPAGGGRGCCWARGQRAARPGSCCRLASCLLLLPVASAPGTVRSGGSRPRKFQSLGLRERRNARPPHVGPARPQPSADCRAARCAPLLRGAGGSPARMRAARASLRLGTPGDTRSPSLSYTKGVAVARQRCE